MRHLRQVKPLTLLISLLFSGVFSSAYAQNSEPEAPATMQHEASAHADTVSPRHKRMMQQDGMHQMHHAKSDESQRVDGKSDKGNKKMQHRHQGAGRSMKGHDMHQMHSMNSTSSMGMVNAMDSMNCDMDNHNPSSTAGHAMCMGEQVAPLALPTGQPLNSLPILRNESAQLGQFTTTLKPAPVEVELEKGTKTTLWLYNQMLLPVIEANVGDQVTIHVDNQLPEETTVHWHGLSVPPEQDGNPQDPIKKGEKHTYQFTLTPEMAGSNWFHPHAHNVTAKQVYHGLAGLFIVRDPNDPLRHIPEQNLFFSDLKLDKNGQIAPNSMMDEMNGREGQYALVNGQNQPVMTVDGTQRLRMWNGNSGRYLNLDFPTDKVEAFLVATDGTLLEAPQKITQLLLTPGERADVVVTPKVDGEFALTALAYDRQKMGMVPAEKDRVLATVKLKKKTPLVVPSQLSVMEDRGVPQAQFQLVYTEDNQMNFMINGKQHDMNRMDWETVKGQVEEWEIFNNSHMDHNFHLHGLPFLIQEFELDGKVTPAPYKMLKDTVNLRPYEKVRVITMQNHEGIRMYHCHILEHEDAGMMGQILVK